MVSILETKRIWLLSRDSIVERSATIYLKKKESGGICDLYSVTRYDEAQVDELWVFKKFKSVGRDVSIEILEKRIEQAQEVYRKLPEPSDRGATFPISIIFGVIDFDEEVFGYLYNAKPAVSYCSFQEYVSSPKYVERSFESNMKLAKELCRHVEDSRSSGVLVPALILPSDVYFSVDVNVTVEIDYVSVFLADLFATGRRGGRKDCFFYPPDYKFGVVQNELTDLNWNLSTLVFYLLLGEAPFTNDWLTRSDENIRKGIAKWPYSDDLPFLGNIEAWSSFKENYKFLAKEFVENYQKGFSNPGKRSSYAKWPLLFDKEMKVVRRQLSKRKAEGHFLDFAMAAVSLVVMLILSLSISSNKLETEKVALYDVSMDDLDLVEGTFYGYVRIGAERQTVSLVVSDIVIPEVGTTTFSYDLIRKGTYRTSDDGFFVPNSRTITLDNNVLLYYDQGTRSLKCVYGCSGSLDYVE